MVVVTTFNPFLPTVAFNICYPRDCVSRHNGGTAGAPLKWRVLRTSDWSFSSGPQQDLNKHSLRVSWTCAVVLPCITIRSVSLQLLCCWPTPHNNCVVVSCCYLFVRVSSQFMVVFINFSTADSQLQFRTSWPQQNSVGNWWIAAVYETSGYTRYANFRSIISNSFKSIHRRVHNLNCRL